MTQALASSSAPYADDVPVGVFVAKAPRGQFVYANVAFLELFGLSSMADAARPAAETGYSIRDLEGRPYPPARHPFWRAVQERATVTADDMVLHRADGSKIRLGATAKPIHADGGNVSHVVVAFFPLPTDFEPASGDSSEGPETLRIALREREQVARLNERLRDAVNHAPLLILAVDREGVFTLAEGSSLSELGVSSTHLPGESIFTVCRQYPLIVRSVQRALKGEAFSEVVEVGSLVFEAWCAPIAGPEGGVLVVATDVTERRRMQATLLSAERMVAVGTIAASVAHEINNPLSYVIACLELVMRDGHPVMDICSLLRARYPADADVGRLAFELEKMREPFENIRDGIERMRLIARDLRTFARADEHEAAPIDVREVLRSAIRMASNETRYRASVVTDFAPVPWVLGSEPRLAQVFLNLLVNAAQAFPEDGRPGSCDIRISTSVDETGNVVVEVRDNGPGIAPDVLPRIFEPFFTTKPVGIGTGLGLSVCRNIVESYGGQIGAESEIGKGSMFFVVLPAAVSPAPASSKRQPREASVKPPRVLVVDDDKVLGNAFHMTLSREFDVRVVPGGVEALEVLADDGTYDFIFCDLMMPEMTGMDFFAQLSRRQPEIADKVLFMTGGVYSPEVRAFISRVPNRCLQKPFDPAVVIREALARRR